MRFLVITRTAAAIGTSALAHGEVNQTLDHAAKLAKYGVMLGTATLRPKSEGLRIEFSGRRRTFESGALPELNGEFVSYVLIEVRNRAEAIEWCRRVPSPCSDDGTGAIEVLQLADCQLTQIAPD